MQHVVDMRTNKMTTNENKQEMTSFNVEKKEESTEQLALHSEDS